MNVYFIMHSGTPLRYSLKCQLENPSAGISCCKVNPWNANFVAISTWTGQVEIYSTTDGKISDRYEIGCPQLAVEWVNVNVCASGGADGVLYFNGIRVGEHSGPISCLSYLPGYLVSGSWDKTVKVWDVKSRFGVLDYVLENKVLKIANDGTSRVFCACTERTIVSFDINAQDLLQQSPITRPTPIPYQTRSLAANDGYMAIGVCEGRIVIESLYEEDRTFHAFKAHIADSDGMKIVYPVNALEFQPGTNCILTGGADGNVVLINMETQRIIQPLKDEHNEQFDTSIASVSFSKDGRTLAVAVSYCWENGAVDHPPDRLVIYTV